MPGAVNRDHVHMLLPIAPSLSVSRAVQHLKGRSSDKLPSEFGILRKRYWGARHYSQLVAAVRATVVHRSLFDPMQ
jgi:REP element-mobilizing transposase RayT